MYPPTDGKGDREANRKRERPHIPANASLGSLRVIARTAHGTAGYDQEHIKHNTQQKQQQRSDALVDADGLPCCGGRGWWWARRGPGFRS